MELTTIDGGRVSLDAAAVDALKSRIRGQLVKPGETGYDESRSVWNAMIDRHPGLIVRCLGSVDVAACIRWARDNGVRVCIKAGGHNIAGLATDDGALMLDLSAMRAVWVDPDARLARVQGGCLLGDIDRETQDYGLAAVLGFVSATGAAGLTLGGGFGYLTRRWGWTTDTVAGFDVVTADGERTRADADHNADLYWGLQGGGGNFGVVTGIDYRLHPVGPDVMGGLVAWRAADAPAVLGLYRELSAAAPPELTLVCIMRPAPPAPWLPKEIHGQPIIAIMACHSGSVDQGEASVAPIKAMGAPVGDVLVRRPYTQLQAMLDATQPKGRRYYWKSEYLSAVTPDLCERFMAHAAGIRSPHSAVILFQIGGALNELPNDHSAVGNRDARYVLNVAAAWEQASEDDAHIGWARGAWDDLKVFSTGGTYVNFLTQDEGADRVASALGANLTRLRSIKARWDPSNFFRTNRNIPPLKADESAEARAA